LQWKKILALSLLVVLLVGMMGCGEKDGGGTSAPEGVELSNTLTYSEYLDDPDYGNGGKTSTSINVDMSSNTSGDIKISTASFVLTWVEGPAESDKHGGEDTFTIEVTLGGETKTANGNSNRLEISFDAEENATDEEEEPELESTASIDIAISDCGSDPAGLAGILFITPDRGNDFTLTVDYEYIEYGDLEETDED